MKKPIIYLPLKNASRIKVFIPFDLYEVRALFKNLDTSFWHPNQKLWSIVNTTQNMVLIKNIFNKNFEIKDSKEYRSIDKRELDDKSKDALLELEKVLYVKRYGATTIAIYKNMLSIFFSNFMEHKFKTITKEQIEGFIYQLIKKNGISESYQNQMINAIKAYYEHVLGLPREYYEIKRPKKSVSLPNVLSENEVLRIIQSPKNIKHSAILTTIYSAGLRISELPNLRVVDIHSEEGFIFVKDTKGKKDRKTILSQYLVTLLRAYYKEYKPSYWLFEGQSGGKYSTSSINAIFRKAVSATNSNPWATVHTLRHSFATHCIQNNVNMRHIQNMLGHNSPKTTEIYTKMIEINNKKITSPLDYLLNKDNLRT